MNVPAILCDTIYFNSFDEKEFKTFCISDNNIKIHYLGDLTNKIILKLSIYGQRILTKYELGDISSEGGFKSYIIIKILDINKHRNLYKEICKIKISAPADKDFIKF